VWLANNWEHVPLQTNLGGHALVVFIGLAAPVKAPLIGPPEEPRCSIECLANISTEPREESGLDAEGGRS